MAIRPPLCPRYKWDEYGHPSTPALPDPSKLSNAQPERYRQTANGMIVQYWEIKSATALAPPVIGYLILFGVLPWIG